MNKSLSLCLALASLLFATIAQAHDVNANTVVVVQPDRAPVAAPRASRPSVFVSGYRGLFAGGLAGASAGYLIESGDGRTIGFSAGIGALSGAGLGITLGWLDLGMDDGRAHLVMRDTLYGTLFGGLTGVVAGSLFILRSGEGEDALLGATIGTLSGAGLGLVIGFVDGYGVFGRRRDCASGQCSARRYSPSLATTADVHGSLIVSPGLTGRF